MTNFMLLFLDRVLQGRLDKLSLLWLILIALTPIYQPCNCANRYDTYLTTNEPTTLWSSQESLLGTTKSQEKLASSSKASAMNNHIHNFKVKSQSKHKSRTTSYDDPRQPKPQLLKSNRKVTPHLDTSKRQFAPSDDFNSGSQLGNGDTLDFNYEKNDLDAVEMHTNNHQSTATASSNNNDHSQVNELQPASHGNSRHYNNYINPMYDHAEVYGSSAGSNTKHKHQQQQQHGSSSHQTIPHQQNLGSLFYSGKQTSHLFPSKPVNSNLALSSMQNLNYIQNLLIGGKPAANTNQQHYGQQQQQQSQQTSSIGIASISAQSSPNLHNSLSLYSVPNLSAVQQLFLQSASSSPTSSGSSQGQLKLISNPQQYLTSNSLDAWDGSGNYLQQQHQQNLQQLNGFNVAITTTTTNPVTSSSHGEENIVHEQNGSNDNNRFNNSAYSIDGIANCGRQQVNRREPRIVGGNSTYEGEFPWAVSIQRHGNHHCGGVIVGRRWILTAAHCVRSQLVANLIVRTGGHTLSRSPNGINSHLERDYLVDSMIMHGDFSKYDNLTTSQQFKSSANTNNADIALIKLRNEIQWNEYAWPVCFANRDVGNFSGHDAIVIGWGKLSEKSEDFSNELQKVKLNIIDNKLCQNWFRQAGREMPINERIICAGFKSGGKDACHGDSGGPLLSKVNGQFVVVGVVSTGIGCARPLLPGLYSRVSSYIDWIEDQVH